MGFKGLTKEMNWINPFSEKNDDYTVRQGVAYNNKLTHSSPSNPFLFWNIKRNDKKLWTWAFFGAGPNLI